MLFDVIKNNPGCPILCFDLTGLTKINEISRMAGDAAIMETLRRINDLRYPDAPLFRLGGDEFAMLAPGADKSVPSLRYIYCVSPIGGWKNGKRKEICKNEKSSIGCHGVHIHDGRCEPFF